MTFKNIVIFTLYPLAITHLFINNVGRLNTNDTCANA